VHGQRERQAKRDRALTAQEGYPLFFKPMLAGASLRDRMVGSAGALIGMAATYALCSLLHFDSSLPLLVAPMGASAVLIFAVPASPLAQPWPVIGGNVVSVFVGVTAARYVPVLPIAIGVAVGGAILVMSLLRCLHPPGGATALIAVIGGPAVASAGYGFAILPVGINVVVLTAVALLFHRVSGHSYPHRTIIRAAEALPPAPELLHRDDIDLALAALGETFDVSREDLDQLLRHAEDNARRRRETSR
jgi:CBS domain-containing membrane protein